MTTTPATQDPRPQLFLALDQMAKLFAEITPDQLDRPTPCTEFTLRQLLSHVVGAIHRLTYMGEGGPAEDVAPITGNVPDDGWSAALGRARTRVEAAWADDAKLDRPTLAPWGEVPGRAVLGGYVMEMVTHAWDIAQALGTGFQLDDALAHTALVIAEMVLPAERRGGPVPFGEVRPVDPDADIHTRLAAWLGRTA
ncbi:TIGR03086 family protein [Kitasatospora aureofaciens]|uniref:TIGR03086 family metal-binding protein n=1 Tax=Kitasatospora aureofaciens TaxID=1894 RepID=UPI001C448D48|nr:TIGR03086 family metal-binding protein [Kitasatospora aureofaciens]MBV6695971.1 TIGR03086 family protein [Kitasatospora aureofaciens]